MTTHNMTTRPNNVTLECPQEIKGIGSSIRRVSSKFLASLVSDWKKRRQQRIDRDAFLNLLRLDERELRDIGLTRDDVLLASKMPLSYNAALELEKRKGLKG